MASFVSSKAGSEARVCTDWMEFEIDKLTNSKNIQNHLKLVCFFNVFLFFLLAVLQVQQNSKVLVRSLALMFLPTLPTVHSLGLLQVQSAGLVELVCLEAGSLDVHFYPLRQSNGTRADS